MGKIRWRACTHTVGCLLAMILYHHHVCICVIARPPDLMSWYDAQMWWRDHWRDHWVTIPFCDQPPSH